MRRIGRRNRRSKKNILATSIFLLVLVGGLVGYASLHESLQIQGNTTVAKNVWNVRFNNVQVLDNHAQVETAPQIIDNGSQVNFVIKLDKPGDSYSFTVDVENNGDIDAMIGTKQIVDGLAAKTNYLEYSLSYLDGTNIQEGDALRKGDKETIKFSVTFKKDITANDLETSAEQELIMTLTNTYVQTDGTEHNINHPIVCTKAVSLHTEECTRTDNYGCRKNNDYEVGEYVTYGHTNGTTLTSGYALDCDLNGNGQVDDDERFYYVSDLYTGTVDGVDQFDSNYAVLIYHKNTGTSATSYYYENGVKTNRLGPVTLLPNLPTRSNWTNTRINLKNNTRTIVNEHGLEVVNRGNDTIENPFTYTDKVGRLITMQEVENGCDSLNTNNDLTDCTYLREDTGYTKTSECSGGDCQYWLENPFDDFSNTACLISSGSADGIYCGDVRDIHATRPAIEVYKKNISLN